MSARWRRLAGEGEAVKVGSLFAGIGGFDLGFERAGFTVAWHAEIDRAASAILAHRWPGVPNLGDVTKIGGAAIEPVDVICGGFPCQDLSVAGKRAGFTGTRSVLAFEFLRIVSEMRSGTDGRAPTFVVLENVPGLFSSAGGRDFGALLDALGELGPMDLAWRVLDSRYFGVAQRRRRVFIVVDFGGERCDEILALTEGLRGDSPARGEAREDVAGTLGGGSEKGGMRTTDLGGHGAYVTAHTLRADGFDASEDGTGRGTPLVVAATLSANGHPNSNAPGRRREDDENLVPFLADPISAHEQSTYTHEGKGNFRLRNVIPFDTTQVTSPANYSSPEPGAPCRPLAAGAHAPAVAFEPRFVRNGRGAPDTVCPPLKAQNGTSGKGDGAPAVIAPAVAFREVAQALTGNYGKQPDNSDTNLEPTLAGSASGVRRLTPTECERLQSFPDGWTAIPGMADGPRYKCLGNAVTVNVAEWIARHIAEALP